MFQMNSTQNKTKITVFQFQAYIFSSFSETMGTSHTKDPEIDLFVDTEKPYYVSGEYVQGRAFVNAKKTRFYHNLTLYLIGNEYVSWKDGSGKDKKTFVNKHENYSAHFILEDFKGTVPEGQYTFPFTFLLPNMMCGSFFKSDKCYIKYALRLQLIHTTNDSKTQFFQTPMNIVQPPRIPSKMTKISCQRDSKCCGSCKDYGTIELSMSCDKNFAVTGDEINIEGKINNQNGRAVIKHCSVTLEQRVIAVSDNNIIREAVEYEWPMYQVTQKIKKGDSYNFQFSNNIPGSIDACTAIGKITARFFVLHLQTDYGCCNQKADAKLHLLVHSRVPLLTKKIAIPPPPKNWDPEIYPQVVCEQMKPFLFDPEPRIPYHNLPQLTSSNLKEIKKILQEDGDGENMYSSKLLVKNAIPSDINLFNSYEPKYHSTTSSETQNNIQPIRTSNYSKNQ